MGGSGRPPQAETEEELARRVRALREALERSAVNAGSMDAAWDSIGNRFAAIDAAIHPAQARVQTSIKVHENIERTIGVAEGILDQHAIVRRAEATVTKGPRENLEGFLEAVDQLKRVVRFFSSIANPKSCEEVLNHVKKLLTDAAMTIEDEFRQLMCTCSEPVEPDCLFECLQKLIYTSNGTNEAVEEEPSQSSALFRNPTLIPQRILPLLHDIARQLVQDDNQQSCHRIYRLFVDSRPVNIES